MKNKTWISSATWQREKRWSEFKMTGSTCTWEEWQILDNISAGNISEYTCDTLKALVDGHIVFHNKTIPALIEQELNHRNEQN